MPTRLQHRIAVVGAGPIGSALAGHLILAGNKVTIGTRRPDAFTPPDYQREDIVAPFAEVYRNRLAGAVIIDPSNPFLWHDDGVMTIKDAPY
jgi:3-hydroxyisobutyrate dehydrogenase-like beta-hydroxyacid dehydrogenase